MQFLLLIECLNIKVNSLILSILYFCSAFEYYIFLQCVLKQFGFHSKKQLHIMNTAQWLSQKILSGWSDPNWKIFKFLIYLYYVIVFSIINTFPLIFLCFLFPSLALSQKPKVYYTVSFHILIMNQAKPVDDKPTFKKLAVF